MPPDDAQGDVVEIEFTGTIRLWQGDIAEADGNVEQAIQNLIGGSGAQVVSVP